MGAVRTALTADPAGGARNRLSGVRIREISGEPGVGIGVWFSTHEIGWLYGAQKNSGYQFMHAKKKIMTRFENHSDLTS
jgi:hypothetical protein